MELTGHRHIKAEPETVWAGITDPQVLKDCIPGCEAMDGSVAEGFTATVVQRVGPIKATFRGRLELSDVHPGKGCRVAGAGGMGEATNLASGTATIALTPEGAGTRLHYDVTVALRGRLEHFGPRLVGGAAQRAIDGFFDRFETRLLTGEPAVAERKGWFRKKSDG